jgi:hypothetical protein
MAGRAVFHSFCGDLQMNTVIHTHEDRHPAPHPTVELRVRYLGARRRFEDPKADAKESLAQVKPAVLAFFDLKEGAADGGTKVYEFALHGMVLPDLNQTLGALAGEQKELKLDLLERFEQG